MANSIDKALDDYKKAVIKEVMEEFRHDAPIAMDYMVDELQRETTNMFNSLITQFYSYVTTSYVRHWEGKPGTGKGSNMYYAFHAKKRHKGKYPYLMVKIDADDVAGGYRWGSPTQVVDFVMSGTRWPWEYGSMHIMEWTGAYSGKYFAYRGTPYDIFESFFENFENIATPIFFKKFHELGW